MVDSLSPETPSSRRSKLSTFLKGSSAKRKTHSLNSRYDRLMGTHTPSITSKTSSSSARLYSVRENEDGGSNSSQARVVGLREGLGLSQLGLRGMKKVSSRGTSGPLTGETVFARQLASSPTDRLSAKPNTNDPYSPNHFSPQQDFTSSQDSGPPVELYHRVGRISSDPHRGQGNLAGLQTKGYHDRTQERDAEQPADPLAPRSVRHVTCGAQPNRWPSSEALLLPDPIPFNQPDYRHQSRPMLPSKPPIRNWSQIPQTPHQQHPPRYPGFAPQMVNAQFQPNQVYYPMTPQHQVYGSRFANQTPQTYQPPPPPPPPLPASLDTSILTTAVSQALVQLVNSANLRVNQPQPFIPQLQAAQHVQQPQQRYDVHSHQTPVGPQVNHHVHNNYGYENNFNLGQYNVPPQAKDDGTSQTVEEATQKTGTPHKVRFQPSPETFSSASSTSPLFPNSFSPTTHLRPGAGPARSPSLSATHLNRWPSSEGLLPKTSTPQKRRPKTIHEYDPLATPTKSALKRSRSYESLRAYDHLEMKEREFSGNIHIPPKLGDVHQAILAQASTPVKLARLRSRRDVGALEEMASRYNENVVQAAEDGHQSKDERVGNKRHRSSKPLSEIPVEATSSNPPTASRETAARTSRAVQQPKTRFSPQKSQDEPIATRLRSRSLPDPRQRPNYKEPSLTSSSSQGLQASPSDSEEDENRQTNKRSPRRRQPTISASAMWNSFAPAYQRSILQRILEDQPRREPSGKMDSPTPSTIGTYRDSVDDDQDDDDDDADEENRRPEGRDEIELFSDDGEDVVLYATGRQGRIIGDNDLQGNQEDALNTSDGGSRSISRGSALLTKGLKIDVDSRSRLSTVDEEGEEDVEELSLETIFLGPISTSPQASLISPHPSIQKISVSEKIRRKAVVVEPAPESQLMEEEEEENRAMSPGDFGDGGQLGFTIWRDHY